MNRILCCLLLTSAVAVADDWPQWMGPNRDNVWNEDGIVETFSESGPKVLWRSEVAGGYSGPAVVDGRIFLTDYVTKDDVQIANFDRKESSGVERVLCIDEKTGKLIWKHEYAVKYSVSYPAGPRCTPTVKDGLVYTLGTEGHLFCFKVDSSEPVWAKQLRDDYNTKAALWGYTNHPLIDGDKLICIAGGENSHVVAFDKNTGKELWKNLTAREQGYVPPSIIEAGGTRQLIVMSPQFMASVDPETGKQFWQVPYNATNGSIIMTPIHFQNYLYVAGYSSKNLLVKLGADQPTAEVVWQDKPRHAISPVNVQPIRDEDVLYGVGQGGKMYAMKLPSGDRLWESNEPVSENGKRPLQTGTAFIVRNGKRYIFFNEHGELILGKLTPERFEETDRAKVIEPSGLAFGRKVVWSMPAFANKHAYIRNDKELICVDLAK